MLIESDACDSTLLNWGNVKVFRLAVAPIKKRISVVQITRCQTTFYSIVSRNTSKCSFDFPFLHFLQLGLLSELSRNKRDHASSPGSLKSDSIIHSESFRLRLAPPPLTDWQPAVFLFLFAETRKSSCGGLGRKQLELGQLNLVDTTMSTRRAGVLLLVFKDRGWNEVLLTIAGRGGKISVGRDTECRICFLNFGRKWFKVCMNQSKSLGGFRWYLLEDDIH